MLYDRDYRILTEEEKLIWEKVEAQLNKVRKKEITIKALNRYYKDIPRAALHYQQLFPNNFLNTDDLGNREQLLSIVQDFRSLLDASTTEREVLNFIREKRGYFIIASLLKSQHYLFGHHETFAFKEFELPPNHFVDFLLVGKNSGGYEFVFIELESPRGQITTAEGEFGWSIRKGLQQVDDWDSWMESNYSILSKVFDKSLGLMQQLPREFHELDKSRLHYVVIAGRRDDFSKKTYQLKRKLFKTKNVLLLHYDNLFDSVDFLLEAGTY